MEAEVCPPEYENYVPCYYNVTDAVERLGSRGRRPQVQLVRIFYNFLTSPRQGGGGMPARVRELRDLLLQHHGRHRTSRI